MMNNKQTMTVAAVAGVLAALLAWAWFAGKERALDSMSAPAPALVAADHIASGARLDKTMVEVKQVPRAFIQPGALKDPAEAEGQVALAPFARGEQILANKLTTTGVALALAVPPGKRAASVAVDPASGVAGLLKPGDLVDVIVTVDDGGSPRTFALMQAAPVLAVGKSFSPREPAQSADSLLVAASSADTVTLAASPYEAEQLTHLEAAGRLKLVLRSPGDREKVSLPAITGVKGVRPSSGGDEEVKRR
jgi:pilus assembly protein CpaB